MENISFEERAEKAIDRAENKGPGESAMFYLLIALVYAVLAVSRKIEYLRPFGIPGKAGQL